MAGKSWCCVNARSDACDKGHHANFSFIFVTSRFYFFFLYTKKISPNSIDSEETQIELLAWPKSQSYM